MIPSDPRTWTEFRKPAEHGFEKVDCYTTLERLLFTSAIVPAVVVALILWESGWLR